MFRERVAQKPTMPVRAGKKKIQNCPAFLPPGANAEGVSSIGPNPWAWR